MKILIFISALFFSNLAFSQQPEKVYIPADSHKALHNETISQVNSVSSPTVIWSEDFSGGFPTGWSTSSTNTVGGIATCPWVWSNDGSWGYWNSNQGTSPAAGINSTSAANGFLISDPDSANNTAYGQPSGSTYQYINSQFTTSSISTLGYPAVTLEFEQLFRFNNNVNLVVSVSSDSISWTDYFVQGNITNNTQSPNPETVSINVSSVAANQANVYIKVSWEARVYYWMIDDMRIIETPNNAVSISDEVIGGWWQGYQSAGGIGCDYTFYPLSQATANPYSFEAVIKNSGSATQNMTLNTKVTDVTQNTVFTSLSNPITLVSSQQDTFVANQTFTPASVGLYNIEMWGVGDSANTDTATKQTVVTDYVYGKDENTYQGFYVIANATRQNHVTSYFDIYDNVNLTAVEVYISPNSVPGAKIYGILYENDPSAGAAPIYLDQTDDYTITSADRDNWVKIYFASPIPLIAGTAYEMGIGGYQHPIEFSEVGYSGTALGTENSLYDEIGTSTNSNGVPTWYYITRNPMIRMNFDPGNINSTQELINKNRFNIYPNPSEGIVNINFSDNICKGEKIIVTNVLGRKVFDYSVTEASESTNLKIKDLTPGIYTVTFEGAKYRISKNLIIK